MNVAPNGPFLVKGDFIIIDKNGKELPKIEKAMLCRCGKSRNMPFCDGYHKEIDFRG
ncbi:MAG: CDGSH iron-sulfur domain-containing protein [Bacteroidales bacterium]|nr:CDGSH iron-sulfur domain-containing protein [Bacteroidales bacterium]